MDRLSHFFNLKRYFYQLYLHSETKKRDVFTSHHVKKVLDLERLEVIVEVGCSKSCMCMVIGEIFTNGM